MKKVITYQTPSGDNINLTPKQIAVLEKAHKWPTNNRGEEYCTVSHGLHAGTLDCDTNLLSDLLAL